MIKQSAKDLVALAASYLEQARHVYDVEEFLRLVHISIESLEDAVNDGIDERSFEALARELRKKGNAS